jgi:hypothetical protein
MKSTTAILILLIFFDVGQVVSQEHKLVKRITTDNLVKINYDKLQKIDTVTAYRLCEKYSILHEWELKEKIIKEFDSEEYLK